MFWRKRQHQKSGYTVICCKDYPECKEKIKELRIPYKKDVILLSQLSLHHWQEKLSGKPVCKYYGVSKEMLLRYGCNITQDAEALV